MNTRYPLRAGRRVRLRTVAGAAAWRAAVATCLLLTACSEDDPSAASIDQPSTSMNPMGGNPTPPGTPVTAGPAAGGMPNMAGAPSPNAAMPNTGTPTPPPAQPSSGPPAQAPGPGIAVPMGPGTGDGEGQGGGPDTPVGMGALDPADAGMGTEPDNSGLDTGACTRELLSTTVETYFTALAANDPDMLPLADTVKFTENGETLELGDGLWANAGMVKFQESLLDTELCGTVTEAVVPDGSTDIPLAVRLRLEGQKITEIQTIAVREGDYFVASNTSRMVALSPWGEPIPEAERAPREQLEGWMDKYFRMFPRGVCDLASECDRMENGFTLDCSAGASCASGDPTGAGVMQPQIILVDLEAGLVAGFTMFLGQYTDVHMAHYAGGEIRGVHTILGDADSSGWD